ncbi:MAG: hypothetical protein APF84_14495 [Gracilibacter sp. BRH_c7a]|nr:MAG: hypothetical protein APF84_14495 [Gracilibacter sp. BRH_c7a]
MIKLIKNEMIKMFARKSTWVMIAFVIVLTSFSSIVMYKMSPEKPENSRVFYEQQIESSKQALETPFLPDYQKDELKKSIKINEYILENNLPMEPSLWEQVQDNSSLIVLIAIFISSAAATIVASEFSQGTIKLLLIRPLSRSKVLLSKYLAVMSLGLIMIVVLFIVSVVVSGLLFGFDGAAKPYLYIGSEGNVVEVDMVYKTMESYGLKSVAILMYPTLAFMLAVVFRTNALAQGLTIVSIILGPQVANALTDYSWTKYLLFAHTDPSLTLSGNPFGVSFAFSILILGIYFVLMNSISWYTFRKRDIMGQ